MSLPLDRSPNAGSWDAAAVVARALDDVRRAATDRVNAMPAIVAAVKAYATVGEITTALVSVVGRYREPVRFEG